MSIGSGSPVGDVGSAGIPGMSGGASGIAGTSGTDSGTLYSATIAPPDVPRAGGTKPASASSNQVRRSDVLGAMRSLHRFAALAATIALLGEAPVTSAPSE